MKLLDSAAFVALSALQAAHVCAKHANGHFGGLEHRHVHHARAPRASPAEAISAPKEYALEKRGSCLFPSGAGLVEVTPDFSNAGWAMSPNQPCTPGKYCPYACPPGQMMAQWSPQAVKYPSMNGGLYCNSNGEMEKPFPGKPYCITGSENIGVKDLTGMGSAWCQTVLPGNEAMLIPTNVQGEATLAIPTTEYWLETSAHFYINPPGVTCEEGCVWGTSAKPYGNWAPFVAGGNKDSSGNTFIKFGWNPIYLEPETPFRNEPPTFGVEIVCDGDGCNGLPCAYVPGKHGVNELSGEQGSGAGGATFCVVTVPEGVNAKYVVSNGNGGGSSGSTSSSDSDGSRNSGSSNVTPPAPEAPVFHPKPKPKPEPKPKSEPAKTVEALEVGPSKVPLEPPVFHENHKSSSVSSTTSTTSSLSSSSIASTTSAASSETSSTSTSTYSLSSSSISSYSLSSSSSFSSSAEPTSKTAIKALYIPHILHENSTTVVPTGSHAQGSTTPHTTATATHTVHGPSSASFGPAAATSIAAAHHSRVRANDLSFVGLAAFLALLW